MIENIEELIKKAEKILPDEDLFLEVIRDLIKDEIKSYLKDRIEKNPEIRKELREAILKYVNAKVMEAESSTILLKALGELGIITLPPEIKKDIISHFYKTFQKEIDEILEKTL
ncbi:MAG: hypothetical protein J7L63_06070 [Thermoplasmata archaeon]|nr:hypothetical protein [Thermoplasmata archaeon]